MALTVINYGNVSTGTNSTTNPVSVSVTVGANSNILIVTAPAWSGYPNYISASGVTYNGISLTLANSIGNGAHASLGYGYSSATIFYLLNPPIGTYTLSVSYNGSSGKDYSIGFLTLHNTVGTISIGNQSTQANDSAASITMSTTVGSYVVDALGFTNTASLPAPSAGQTLLSSIRDANGDGAGSSYKQIASTSTTLTWSQATYQVAYITTEFVENTKKATASFLYEFLSSN